MGNLAIFLIGVVFGILSGTVLGAYVTFKFDTYNNIYNIEKIRAKKGANIDINQDIPIAKKDKLLDKLFKNRKHKLFKHKK